MFRALCILTSSLLAATALPVYAESKDDKCVEEYTENCRIEDPEIIIQELRKDEVRNRLIALARRAHDAGFSLDCEAVGNRANSIGQACCRAFNDLIEVAYTEKEFDQGNVVIAFCYGRG